MDITYIEKRTVEYYDLFEILEEMESRGFMSKDKVWKDYVTEWGVQPNAIFYLGFWYYEETEFKGDRYREYFSEVNRMLDLPEDNDGIMVKVEW